MRAYAQRHWYGQQSLAWAFWINLVLVRGLVFVVQSAVMPPEGADYSAYPKLVLTGVFAFHVVLLVWQVVGVVRAAERHFSEHGNMALVWGAQLGSVLMFVLSAVYALGAVQMILPSHPEIDVLAQMSDTHAQQYSLEISADKQSVHIDGLIELGITRAVNAYLREHESVETVVLSSSGGNIYEGRGLARLVAENGLNTHVDATCASACTIAFTGGQRRSAGIAARFGFHQYRIDADYTIIVTDVAKEQRRDQKLLIDAGVTSEFVGNVFSHPSAAMWWPPLQELIVAGFLHELQTDVK